MKVLMILPTLAGNTMVRPYAFYNMLAKAGHEVIFAGFINKRKSSVYLPYNKIAKFHEIDTSSFKSMINGLKQLKNLAKKSDVIHSTTSLFNSNFFAWILSKIYKKPLIIDIFDLDFNPKNFFEKIHLNTIGQWIVKRNKYNIVHSSLLKKIYGGTIIRTGTDTELYKPKIKDAKELKKSLGLENKIIIPFLGTPRRYKGIELILRAIKSLNNKKIVFLIVGPTNDIHFKKLYPEFKEFIKLVSPKPFTEMPKYLAISDIVLLPQLNYGPWCEAQIPAKLYDSMSAAKPIIITDVGDMPKILGNTGIIIKGKFNSTKPAEEEIKKTAEAIQFLIDNKSKAKELGRKARERCLKKYSWNILKDKLIAVYKEAL